MSKAKDWVKELEAGKSCLKWLTKENEKETAERIIYKAAKLGFTSIGLWSSVDQDGNFLEADIKDLVGNGPDGKLYFLYGKI